MEHSYYSWSAQSLAANFPVERSERDEFILADGQPIYDFICTSFQANFGHGFDPIQSRISKQLATLPIASPKSRFDLKQEVSRRLVDLIGLGPGKIFYTVSGAEAVENALKIARQITGRPIVAARQKSYHGASLGALSVTGDWRNDAHLTFDQGTLRIPDHDEDPDLVETERRFLDTGPDKIAAVILETISGTNGMAIPDPAWFHKIQSLCRQHGCLLILDEVLVGFGRCRTDFAFQAYSLEPDMVCMSKAMSGGYIPLGGVWTSAEIARYYDTQTLSCGLTNYAHPLGLAALDGVLASLADPVFRDQMADLETCLQQNLEPLSRGNPRVEIRQRGLMAAIYLDQPAPTWKMGIEHGLHYYSRDNLVIIAPPYISTCSRLDTACASLRKLLGS
ncbi:MAG: aspartate aminotransferase family protein [Mariniblastus sp.]|nr:aspartate aminotransferase family protein [Mariniblastus sp.]